MWFMYIKIKCVFIQVAINLGFCTLLYCMFYALWPLNFGVNRDRMFIYHIAKRCYGSGLIINILCVKNGKIAFYVCHILGSRDNRQVDADLYPCKTKLFSITKNKLKSGNVLTKTITTIILASFGHLKLMFAMKCHLLCMTYCLFCIGISALLLQRSF